MDRLTLKDNFYLKLFFKRWKRLLTNKRVKFGGSLIIGILIVIIFAKYIAPHSPLEINIINRLKPPSLKNIFGTDSFGRDILSRVIWGGRISIFVGAVSTLIVGIFGVILGLISGFFEKADKIIMRIMDGMMAFPGIFLALVIMAVFGPGVYKLIWAISIVYTPRCVRVVRVSVLSIKNLEYIKAVRCLGSSNLRIILKDILPNSLNALIIQLSITFANSILSEAGLSFLGVGVPPPVPSWGNILSEGREYISNAPWISFFSGMAIFITVFLLNILGDGLRDILDPKQYF